MLLLQGDPVGMSSPLGRLFVAASLLAAIGLAVRWFWHQRNR